MDAERIERLARMLHESGRRAVAENKVVNKLGRPFLSWDEIDEDARQCRRMMAEDLARMLPGIEPLLERKDAVVQAQVAQAGTVRASEKP